MKDHDRWLVAWAVGYTAVGTASLLIPLFAIQLGAGAFLIGIIAATAAIAGVPGALWWGWLAERTNQRRVFILISLASIAIVLVLIPFTQSIWVLVSVSSLLWFVVSAAAPVLTLLVVEGTDQSEWESRIALLNAYQGYGWVAGLLLGSVWLPIGSVVSNPVVAKSSLFWVCAVLAVCGFGLTVRWLPAEPTVLVGELIDQPELLARLDRGGGRYIRTVPFATTRLYWGLRSLSIRGIQRSVPRMLWVYLLIVMVFSAGFSVFWGPLPAYLRGRFSDQHVFWLFLASNLAAAMSYIRVGRWSARWSPRLLQFQALAARGVLFPLVGVMVIVLPSSVEFSVVLFVFGVIGLTWAVIAVTATGLVTRLGSKSRGNALGLYTAVTGIGGGVGSIFGGWIAGQFGFIVSFSAAGLLVFLGALGISILKVGREQLVSSN